MPGAISFLVRLESLPIFLISLISFKYKFALKTINFYKAISMQPFVETGEF